MPMVLWMACSLCMVVMHGRSSELLGEIGRCLSKQVRGFAFHDCFFLVVGDGLRLFTSSSYAGNAAWCAFGGQRLMGSRPLSVKRCPLIMTYKNVGGRGSVAAPVKCWAESLLAWLSI